MTIPLAAACRHAKYIWASLLWRALYFSFDRKLRKYFILFRSFFFLFKASPHRILLSNSCLSTGARSFSKRETFWLVWEFETKCPIRVWAVANGQDAGLARESLVRGTMIKGLTIT